MLTFPQVTLNQEENIFGVIKRYIQISSSNISAHVVAPSSVKKWRENTKQTDLKKAAVSREKQHRNLTVKETWREKMARKHETD